MEPKTIPEDLMLELEQSIENCQRLFAQINAINERHRDCEYREWKKDYKSQISVAKGA